MAVAWADTLNQTKIILFDYSALFEAGHSLVFEKLTDTIIAKQIQVVFSSSFNYYHSCVFRAMNVNEKPMLLQLESFLDKLSREKLLVPDPEVMSMAALLSEYAPRKDVCLFTSVHASVLSGIRSTGMAGDFSICVFDKDNYIHYPDVSAFLQSSEPDKVNPVAASTDYLDVAIHVNIGDRVYLENGESVTLSEKISTGSEGLVFKTENPALVAKIYHRGVMTALRWMKLTRMTKMGLNVRGICWPASLLYNQNHEPVGYLMSTAQGYTLGSVFDGQDALLDRFPDWDRSSVVQAACQIFEKIVYLHLHGILIGDIQMKNIMIKSPREVYLIDMDSVQMDDLPCPVGTEEFTPPELWDRSFAAFIRNSQHEDYSCGILAFSVLFCGQHPYNQRLGKETLREEITSRSFPYNCGREDSSGIPLGGYDKIWQAIPEELQNMFCLAFKEGRRYETIEWYAALDSYRSLLSGRSFPDPQAYNLFPYTILRETKPEEGKPAYKRSIRDSIIHVPDNSDKSSAVPDRVMYNGRVTGVAFVNQEKLTELELNKANALAPPEKLDLSSVPAASQNARTISRGPQQKTPAQQESDKRRSTDIKVSRKSKSTKILLALTVVAGIALLTLLYFFYYK